MATEGLKPPDYQHVRPFLKCPVQKNGDLWVEVTFFGKMTPTKENIDKLIELLIVTRNDEL